MHLSKTSDIQRGEAPRRGGEAHNRARSQGQVYKGSFRLIHPLSIYLHIPTYAYICLQILTYTSYACICIHMFTYTYMYLHWPTHTYIYLHVDLFRCAVVFCGLLWRFSFYSLYCTDTCTFCGASRSLPRQVLENLRFCGCRCGLNVIPLRTD